MTQFTLPWANTDLDVHPSPPGTWDRVAVISGWHDAARARKRWPHAAVVGPLRTMRGIEMLVRGLLANPQLRVVVWDGPDITDNQAVKHTLFELWKLAPKAIELMKASELSPYLSTLFDHTYLFDQENYLVVRDDPDAMITTGNLLETWGEAIYLPLSVPQATVTVAPRTAPRFEADTLESLWCQVMGEILRAGRKIDTHYGETLEVLNMVGVIRDPTLTCANIAVDGYEKDTAEKRAPHHLFGFTYDELRAYTDRLISPAKGEGMNYSYGSLLCGDKATIKRCDSCGCTHGLEEKACMTSGCGGTLLPHSKDDQIAALNAAIEADPSYRGHFVTPWHPSKFSRAGAKGKPCLVGVQFRAVPTMKGTECCYCAAETGEEHAGDCQFAGMIQNPDELPVYVLHVTINFRSHDYFAAYPQNLAAVCMWLCDMSARQGMKVGTVTCLSLSAHLYERDWDAARKVVDGYQPPAIRWDQRSSWRVEVSQRMCSAGTCERPEGHNGHHSQFDGPTPKDAMTSPTYFRATAMTPDGSEVIATFEAKTAADLARQCINSDLVTEIGAAVWLGREIERVSKDSP